MRQSQPTTKEEWNALVEALAFDKHQAEQRFANLQATREALRHRVKFSYWPKQPTSILELLA